MSGTVLTVRRLLEKELEQRCYATGIDLKVGDLFSRKAVIPWIEALVGKSASGKLSDRIRRTPTPRLSHTAAVYLLGMALRSRLELHFDQLPRLISHSVSDGFHFYWAMACLCHDLGYTFEHRSKEDKSLLRRMNTVKGRRKVLDIDYDLFRLDREELLRLKLDPEGEEGKWILETVDLAKKYDRFRRQTNHKGKYDPVADHGICGALLLYDILRREHSRMRLLRRRRDGLERHSKTQPHGNLDGAAGDASPRRFIRSGLLIACTVARHNMWLSSTQEEKVIYDLYGMDALQGGGKDVRVRADSGLTQMLFFLDLVDTMDPVKGIYLRDVEAGRQKGECRRCYRERLDMKYGFLMDRLCIGFPDPAEAKTPFFTLSTGSEDRDDLALFSGLARGAASLPDWLELPEPVTWDGHITIKLPPMPRRREELPFGIGDTEINALLLYMGCGVPGRYEEFYSSRRAYQTFNLLMMEGTDGERTRVCEEGQKPSGVFLREWEKSHQIMERIFLAQCRLGRAPEASLEGVTLYRGDRKVNFELMRGRKATYAMTSTSRSRDLDDFLADKVDPCFLEIRVEGKVPHFDYERFFGDQYVYAAEREVLLPPMVPMRYEPLKDGILTFRRRGRTLKKCVRNYKVTLAGFDLSPDALPKDVEPDQYLKDHAEEAASALELLARKRCMEAAGLQDPEHAYWIWKKCYRFVLGEKLRAIYRKEFRT